MGTSQFTSMGNPTDIDLNLRLLLEELWYVSPEFPRQRILKDQIRLIACEPKLELTITPQDAHRHLRGSQVITVFPKTPPASVPPCPTDRRPPTEPRANAPGGDAPGGVPEADGAVAAGPRSAGSTCHLLALPAAPMGSLLGGEGESE